MKMYWPVRPRNELEIGLDLVGREGDPVHHGVEGVAASGRGRRCRSRMSPCSTWAPAARGAPTGRG